MPQAALHTRLRAACSPAFANIPVFARILANASRAQHRDPVKQNCHPPGEFCLWRHPCRPRARRNTTVLPAPDCACPKSASAHHSRRTAIMRPRWVNCAVETLGSRATSVVPAQTTDAQDHWYPNSAPDQTSIAGRYSARSWPFAIGAGFAPRILVAGKDADMRQQLRLPAANGPAAPRPHPPQTAPKPLHPRAQNARRKPSQNRLHSPTAHRCHATPRIAQFLLPATPSGKPQPPEISVNRVGRPPP